MTLLHRGIRSGLGMMPEFTGAPLAFGEYMAQMLPRDSFVVAMVTM